MTAFTDDDAEGRKQQKEQREQVRRKQWAVDEGFRQLFATHEGRMFLRWVLEITNAMGANPYRRDSHDTAFLCGEQNIGQQVLARMMEVNPDGLLAVMKEEADERHANARRYGNPDQPDLFGDEGHLDRDGDTSEYH